MIKNIKLLRYYINNVNHKTSNYTVTDSTLIENKFYLKSIDILSAYALLLEQKKYFENNDINIFLNVFDEISKKLSFSINNDFQLPEEWTHKERINFHEKAHKLNGSIDDFKEELLNDSDFTYTMDYIVAFYLRNYFLNYFNLKQLSNKINYF